MTAPPASSAPTSEQYQAAQVAVGVLVVAALAKLWPSLDLAHLRTSLPAFKAAVAQEVTAHGQAASAAAIEQYLRQRELAGVRGGFRAVVADPPPLAQVAANVEWATDPLWHRDVADHGLAGGHADNATDTETTAGSAIAEAKARLAASAVRMVGNTGAATVVENVGRDRAARGYARIPEAGACSFCLLLASRGAVYKHERSGGRGDSFTAANAKFAGAGAIKVHDHCECHPEPVFNAYEPSARVRAADGLYVVASEGRSGKRALAAYRAAIEGFTNDAAGRPYFTDDQLQRIAPLRAQLT